MNARIFDRRRRLGPALNARHSYSREFLSLRFLKLAEEYEQLASEASQGRNRTLLRQQAELARQHSASVRTELVPSVIYVSRVTDKGYVFWLPGAQTLCAPCPWGIADAKAKRYIEASNLERAGLWQKPIRFDPPAEQTNA